MKNGEPVQLEKGMIIEDICCGCLLTHLRWIDDNWVLRTFRNDYETDKARKRSRRKKQK